MTSIERLSYLEPSLESHPSDLSTLINPCKNLTDAFNSAFEEVEEENLKVFLRIRPLLSEENITSQDGNIDIVNQKAVLLTAPTCSHSFKNKPKGITKLTHKFTFTHVYGQDTSQKILFEETTQDLVKDLVNGQNCLLFTYGATNSGKTYTIQGTSYHPGLLPRTLDVLFKSVGSQQYKGNDLRPHHFCGVIRMNEKECQKEEAIREQVLSLGSSSLSKSYSSMESKVFKDEDTSTIASSFNSTQESTDQTTHSDIFPDGVVDSENAYYAIFVSFAEIYNEYIYDLLERTTLIKAKKSPLVLGEDRNGAIYIKGLREIRVTSVEEAMQVLEVGKMNLHFASTRLNQNSSRSHCIFTIKMIRLADPTHPHVARVSMLSLCDLAGAERSGKTQSSMDRLKEANNINTSLLVLGRCMAALRHNQVISKQLCGPRKTVPIPYRDSKVTRLFQSFFMGKGKVAMIVNISMSSVLFDETLKVLKFSALASKVCITQEKPQLADLSVQEHKRSSQFSHFMRHSLNVSNASSARLSVPWNSKNYADFTFGGGEDKESSRMNNVPEEDEENEDPEKDEKYEVLLQFIEKLKEKLLKECKEKNELEAKLRKEICDAFSERIVEIEDSWKTRLENQRARAEEFMDWRMNLLMESAKEKETSRKRFRSDCDDDEEMVPALLLVKEEAKVRDLQEAKSQLEEEVEALKGSLRASSQSHQNSQEEKSKLLFKLADSNQLIDRLQKQKDELEERLQKVSSPVKSKESTENMILEELQLRLRSLEKNVEEKEMELKNVKSMLVEAADEFLDKEHTINSLKSALEAANETNTRQSVIMSALESKLSETKSLLDSVRLYLEEREQQIHTLNAQLRLVQGDFSVFEETRNSKMGDFRRQTSGFDSEEESPSTSKLILNLNDEDESPDANGESGLDLSSNQGTSFSEVEKKENMEQQLQALKAETESLEAENEKLRQQMKDVEKQLEEFTGFEEKLKEFEDKINLLTLQNKDLKAENEEILARQEEYTEKISDLNDEISQLNDRLESLSLERDLFAEEKKQLQQKQEETQINSCCLEQTLKIYSGNIDTLTSEKINLEETNKDLLKKIRMMEEELRQEVKMKEKSLEETTSLKERIESLEKDKLELENANKFINQCFESKESEYETVLTQVNDKIEHVMHLEFIQTQFEELNLDLENRLKTAEQKQKELEKECEDLKKFMVECDELKTKLSASEESKEKLLEMNSSYSAKIESLTGLLDEKSEEKNLEILTTKNELNELKMKLRQSEEKRSEILSVNSKFVTQIQSLNNLLGEKEELFKKMTEKIDSLDRKASSAEDQIEPLKTKCKMFEKEVAAIREARAEEVSQLKSDLETSQAALAQKDLEISSLQQEVKRSLQASVSNESSERTKQEALKKEEQDKEIQSLQEQLRILEEEKSAYSEQVSSLQQELSHIHETSRSLTETKGNSRSDSLRECNTSSRSRRTRKNISHCSPTIDSVNATPAPATSPVLQFESSEVDSEVNGSTRKLRPNTRRTTRKESSSSKKTTTSQRRTKKLSFDKENQSFDGFTDDDKDDGDFYKPKGILKSSRKNARKKSTRQTHVQNPHLENEEKENLLNSSNKNAKESAGTNKTRSRRMRPLYNLDIEAPFECSPDVVQLPQEDSPHSVVRRKLRSKAK